MIHKGLICVDPKGQLCAGTPGMRNGPISFRAQFGGRIRRCREASAGLVKESNAERQGISSLKLCEVESNDQQEPMQGNEEDLLIAASRHESTKGTGRG